LKHRNDVLLQLKYQTNYFLNFMKKLAIWMLVAFSAAVSFAQVTTSSIGGTILAGGNAVDNASVKAVLTTTNAVYETQTRQGGSFDIFNLQAGGPYTVTVSAPGQKTVTVENV
jgi:hypothetical protein